MTDNKTPILPGNEEAELKKLRIEIDRLDTEMVALISQRAECAMRVAAVKLQADPGSAVFYRPECSPQLALHLVAPPDLLRVLPLERRDGGGFAASFRLHGRFCLVVIVVEPKTPKPLS